MRWWFFVSAIISAIVLLGLAYFLFQYAQPIWLVIVCFFITSLAFIKAYRFRAQLEGFSDSKPPRKRLFFWSSWVLALSLISVGGVYAYAQYLAQKYDLPKVYHSKAALWVLGINRPFPLLVDIPKGRFEMGSNDGEDSEKPVHTVTIDYAFKIGQYEVTFEEYDYYLWSMRQRGFNSLEKLADVGWGREKRPVINVNWNEAQGYVQWLTQTNPEGLVCRLPSEAEWEYAARAGTTTKFYWGDEPNRAYANYGQEECCDGLAEGVDEWVNTAPVDSFKPNAWGLYDMSGNVHEWIQDTWHSDYTGAPTDGSAWETGEFTRRVFRGGSWYSPSNVLRSSTRGHISVNYRNDSFGFRIVCSPPEH